VYGASTYNWRVALASAPTVYLQTAQTTAARILFNDLTAGQVYNVELNSVGAAVRLMLKGLVPWKTLAPVPGTQRKQRAATQSGVAALCGYWM
jgi:hypothetical protein